MTKTELIIEYNYADSLESGFDIKAVFIFTDKSVCNYFKLLVGIKPVLTHCRDGFKVIYILIVYCFYGRKIAVGIESGYCMTLQESALST